MFFPSPTSRRIKVVSKFLLDKWIDREEERPNLGIFLLTTTSSPRLQISPHFDRFKILQTSPRQHVIILGNLLTFYQASKDLLSTFGDTVRGTQLILVIRKN